MLTVTTTAGCSTYKYYAQNRDRQNSASDTLEKEFVGPGEHCFITLG
jgi:hypothetical protein